MKVTLTVILFSYNKHDKYDREHDFIFCPFFVSIRLDSFTVPDNQQRDQRDRTFIKVTTEN